MKTSTRKRDLVSIKLPKNLVKWLKIEAAKADLSMYEIVEERFPEAQKSEARR